jgi:hypothetical protein
MVRLGYGYAGIGMTNYKGNIWACSEIPERRERRRKPDKIAVENFVHVLRISQ